MASHAEQVPHKPSNKEMKQMIKRTEGNTTWELWIDTQMKWTNDLTGEGWEIITGSSSSGPSPTHPRYGQRLHTIRVDETCPHHEKMNIDFNSGNTGTYFTTRVSNRARKNVITIDEMLEILRYVIADGRFTICLKVYDAEEVAGAVEYLDLPKSVGKKITHKYGRQVNPNEDWLDGEWVYTTRDGIEVSYKVNGSTGERNETGEKRMNRFLKEF
mgnify:CR=1 FL=1